MTLKCYITNKCQPLEDEREKSRYLKMTEKEKMTVMTTESMEKYFAA